MDGSIDALFTFMRQHVQESERRQEEAHRRYQRDLEEVKEQFGRPPPPPPPPPELIKTNREIMGQMQALMEENRRHREAIHRLEQEKIATEVAKSLAEQQRREETLAMFREMQNSSRMSAAAATAAQTAANEAAHGNRSAQQFMGLLYNNLTASNAARSGAPESGASGASGAIGASGSGGARASKVRPDPTPAPERGVKRGAETWPAWRRRPRPELVAPTAPPPPPPPPPGAAAIAVEREVRAATTPQLSTVDVKRLAPYAHLTGEEANMLANVVLDEVEKRRKGKKEVEDFEYGADVQNDQSGGVRAPTRFMKYARHVTTMKAKRAAEKKAAAKNVKLTPGRRAARV